MHPPAPWTRRRTVGAVASLLWCVSPVLLLGLEWGIACLTLGHPPVPMIDDPKFISPLSSLLHAVTALSLVTILAAPFTLRFVWLRHSIRNRQTILIAVACFLLPIASIFIFRADPFDIVGWWFD
jgi:hypothetical protein